MLSETKSAVAKGEGGRKILAYLWLPIVSFALLALIYGGLTILDLKNQNQIQNQKQKNLEKQISQLSAEFNQLPLVAGERQQTNIAKTNREIAGAADQTSTQTSTATPTNSTPEPFVKPKSKPSATAAPTSAPTITPTPTPIPTPTPTPTAQATVAIENVGSYQVNLTTSETAFTILLRVAAENGFIIDYELYDFGAFVKCIANICPSQNQYWAFYYNGAYSMVGASAQAVEDGDTTSWQLESF